MTDHVRTSYRKHRRATWGLAIALVLAVAAVAIPIASGAPDKTYTLVFPVTGPQAPPVTPLLGTTGNTALQQNLCTGTTYTSVKLTISNTAPNAQLGSANITFPSIVSLTGASYSGSSPSGATIASTGNVVRLRELSLPKRTGAVTFSVSLNTGSGTAGLTNITAMVKQSNDFSDSGQNPDANAFDNPTLPQLSLQTCNTTISGRVFHDRDADSVFSTGTGAFDNSDLPKGWRVNVFAKSTSSTSFPSTPSEFVDASSTTGEYSVTVPIGRDYKVCVVASGTDASKAWGLQSPIGSQCGPLSSSSGATSAGHVLLNLSAAATGRDFVAVPATPSFGPGDESSIPGYVVIAGSNGIKDPTRYTQEVWVDSGGGTNFRFAPITDCAAPADCSKIHLIETMTADVTLASLNSAQVDLKYDDVPAFDDGDLVSMPYCNTDPRPATWPTDRLLDLTPSVLPSLHSSCIIDAAQTVIPDGKLRIRYVVYTSYDGGRRIG